MIKQNQRYLNLLNLLLDAGLTFASYYIAVFVRFCLLGGKWTINLYDKGHIFILVGYCAVMVVLYYLFRVYSPQRYQRIRFEISAIILTNAMCIFMLASVFFLLKEINVSRVFLALFYLFSTGVVVTKHILVRGFLRTIRAKGYNLKHVILVGSGSLAVEYAINVQKNPQYGCRIMGYVSDEACPELSNHMGTLAELEKILSTRTVDEIVVALGLGQEKWVRNVVLTANQYGIRTSVIPTYNEFMPLNPYIDVLGSIRLINLNANPLDNIINAGVKRLMDIILSSIGLILISPLLMLTAVGVKLSSPGPVFFVQERVGLNKKTFKMLKFRSMRENAVENTAWSTNEDPRKTAFGSFIRKTSIDELPQLINVLKGDMSLVGPRPEIPFHVDHFQYEIPNYLVRQQVRPGITGWAQICGYRGDTDIVKRVELDLWYINHWCLRLDVEILWRTVMGGFMNSEKISR